jgi:hypothetical protein
MDHLRRAQLASFGRRWFNQALTATYKRTSADHSEGAPNEAAVDPALLSPKRAESAGAEVDREMEEVLDFIEASEYGGHHAQSAGAEVDDEIDEVHNDSLASFAALFHVVNIPLLTGA